MLSIGIWALYGIPKIVEMCNLEDRAMNEQERKKENWLTDGILVRFWMVGEK